MLRYALPALLLLAGCTQTAQQAATQAADDARTQARLDKRLAGYAPAKAINCISPLRANEQEIFGDTLVYRDGRTIYVNKTTGGCFGLKRDDIVVTRSYNSQLCRGDIVRTVDRSSAFPSGSCSFGEFVPYKQVAGR